MQNYEQTEATIYERFWSRMNGRFSSDPWHYSSNTPYPAVLDFINFCKQYYYSRLQSKQHNNINFLDIGSGNGRHTTAFAKNNFKSYGVDISPSAIKFARENAKIFKLNITYQIGSVLNLSYEPNYFNILLDAGIFHHLRKNEWSKYKHNILKVLKSNGLFCLVVFSRDTGEVTKLGKRSRDGSYSMRNDHYFHFFIEKEMMYFWDKDFQLLKCYDMKRGESSIIFKIFYLKKR